MVLPPILFYFLLINLQISSNAQELLFPPTDFVKGFMDSQDLVGLIVYAPIDLMKQEMVEIGKDLR